MPFFTEPEEAIDYIYNLLNDNRGTLGLGYIGYADERLLPEYPAVIISFNSAVERTIHATHQFSVAWSIQLVVYHAKLTNSHRTRTKEDMQLAAAIREKLHEDHSLGGGVIFGYVTAETPGVSADDRGQANVATMLVWEAESRVIF